MRKRVASMIMAAVLTAGAAGMAIAGETVYEPGTYSASAAGMGGDVTVTVTVDENSITDVEIEGDQETPGIGSMAVEQMPQMILDAQSEEVDGVATATITSNAIRTALTEALAQARGEESAAEEEKIYEADVIVIGGGGSGLSAAISAANQGASVIVLEAAGITGGDTARAAHIAVITDKLLENAGRNDEDLGGYLELDENDFPEEYRDILATLKEDITAYLDTTDDRKFDSYERIMIDHYTNGLGYDLDGNEVVMDFDLISDAMKNVNNTWQWLLDNTGMPDRDEYYDGRRVRPEGTGMGLTSALLTAAEEKGVTIYTNTRAVKLLTDENGRVNGVTAENKEGEEETYSASNGVVIATGGFQSNAEMASEYQNLYTGVSENTNSTGPATEQGDGIVMAQELGAQLVDMQFVVTIMWGYGGETLSDENRLLAGGHQIYVNVNAERFMDDSSYGKVKPAADQPDGIFFMVGDGSYYETLGADVVEEFEERGLVFTGDTLEEAAEKAGLDSAALQATVDTYNGYVDAGEDPDFGRTEFNGKIENGPFVITKMEAAFHLSLGGLLTDTGARVLNEDGEPIEGLYAAGDVTGAIEGAVHQSADNLSAVIYYGRVAGENAAKAE